MGGRRSSAFVVTTAALIALAALGLVPTPFYLLSPGTAVDLSQRIVVEGRVPPRRHFYLTDVAVTHATALLLLAGLRPGTRVVRRDTLFPAGTNLPDYDRVLTAAMDESQRVAAYVAERAAGLHVGPASRSVVVAEIAPGSLAAGFLRLGDRLVRVDGHPVVAPGDVSAAVTSLHPGDRAQVEVKRDGRLERLNVPTIGTDGRTRLGIFVREQGALPPLPIPVHFSLEDVEGSSGGLMFALAIYADLTGDRRGPDAVAGTGTIAADGMVGPIEGTLQKVIAAKRAGARLFFVPRQNYAEIATERDIAIVPVTSFNEALAALR